jgi:HlyD family secretion protein
MKRIAFALAMASLVSLGCDTDPDGLTAEGTVEIREMDVSPAIPARVVRVLVDEGDSVSAGDTLVVMTQSTLPADIDAREARLATAIAQLRDLEAGARAPELDAARAELRAATSDAERTSRDLERITSLAEAGAVSRQELDAARTAAEMASSRRDAASESLELLAQGARPDRIGAARGEVANARAALDAARATASDLVLEAPSSGVILGRHVDPGEVIAAGTPTVTLGRTTEPWVRVYVPASALHALAVGQSVTVTVPGLERELPGRITTINDRAEFTPRVALTEDERADQMFGVRVDVRGETTLKPGMPATVRFRPIADPAPGVGTSP